MSETSATDNLTSADPTSQPLSIATTDPAFSSSIDLLPSSSSITKLKLIKDLNWPVIDQNQLDVFSDPLRKDEIKPIRQHEWENLATSKALRNLLHAEPELINLLNQLQIMDQDPQRQGEERAPVGTTINERQTKYQIKRLLQLNLSSGSAPKSHLSSNLRPNCTPADLAFNQHQILIFNQFADIVRDILASTR